MDREFVESFVGWLQAQPIGSIVRWTDDGALLDGAHVGFVDIVIAEACDALRVGWQITFVLPDADDCDGVETVGLEPDVDVWFVGDSEGWVADTAVAVPAGSPPSTAERAALGDGATVRPGWSTATLDDALAAWATEHAGRNDLRFVFDPTIVTPLQACGACPEHAGGRVELDALLPTIRWVPADRDCCPGRDS